MKYLLIIKKMKKLFRNILYLIVVLITLNACQSVKDGLSGQKKSNSDEFMVQKKNPLTLPPEFNELPEPETLIKNNSATNDDESDLKKIILKRSSTANKTSITETSNGSLKKSILEKIKSN